MLKTWNELRSELKGFVTLRVQDSEDVKDLLQEIYIKFQTSLPRLKDQQKVTSWLYQITRNTIHDYYRHRLQTRQEDLEGIDVEESLSDDFHQRISMCIQPFIERLPALYKEALLLVEMENVSQLELARKLNISYSGARSRTQRAREKLKEMLLACCRLEIDAYGNVIEAIPKKDCPAC